VQLLITPHRLTPITHSQSFHVASHGAPRAPTPALLNNTRIRCLPSQQFDVTPFWDVRPHPQAQFRGFQITFCTGEICFVDVASGQYSSGPLGSGRRRFQATNIPTAAPVLNP
jgi:hypothetical protein